MTDEDAEPVAPGDPGGSAEPIDPGGPGESAAPVESAVPAESSEGGREPGGTGPDDTDYGEAWVYESFLGALPGVTLSERAAIVLQVGLFGTGVIVLGLWFGVERAILPGLVAVGVAGVGSLAMLRFSRGVRRLDPPEAYRRALFGSSIEVVLAVLAFVALVVYLFVVDPIGTEVDLLVALFGEPLPAVPTYLALLVLWDLCYRIGTSWWAAVVALWRARRIPLDAATARAHRRLDALNVGFAVTQLALVPFVLDRPVLLVAVCGHVLAVAVVETAAIALQR